MFVRFCTVYFTFRSPSPLVALTTNQASGKGNQAAGVSYLHSAERRAAGARVLSPIYRVFLQESLRLLGPI